MWRQNSMKFAVDDFEYRIISHNNYPFNHSNYICSTLDAQQFVMEFIRNKWTIPVCIHTRRHNKKNCIHRKWAPKDLWALNRCRQFVHWQWISLDSIRIHALSWSVCVQVYFDKHALQCKRKVYTKQCSLNQRGQFFSIFFTNQCVDILIRHFSLLAEAHSQHWLYSQCSMRRDASLSIGNTK